MPAILSFTPILTAAVALAPHGDQEHHGHDPIAYPHERSERGTEVREREQRGLENQPRHRQSNDPSDKDVVGHQRQT